jgi:hypothetical protein
LPSRELDDVRGLHSWLNKYCDQTKTELMTRTLVAIANHGTGNRRYLDRLLSEYRRIPGVHIVVLSNIPKDDLGDDVEVVVGTPTANPWSLPFAHRTLFRDRKDDYDLFIYTEDDTLLLPAQLKSAAESIPGLEKTELPGFLRFERGPDGRRSICSVHSFFRWLPGSGVRRGSEFWARFSNPHSALFVADKPRIDSAIASGGFVVAPHFGRLPMPETAASDIYTQCGLSRLIRVSGIDDCLLHHLPDKYLGRMGVSEDELRVCIDALYDIADGKRTSAELFNPETQLPIGACSKNLYAASDTHLAEMLPHGRCRLLSIGSGNGALEASLAAQGADVACVPIDAVLGACCEWRGLRTFEPALDAITGSGPYDAVLLYDVLHLVDDQSEWLRAAFNSLRDGGVVVARAPNVSDLGFRRRLRRSESYQGLALDRASLGMWPMSPRRIKRALQQAGFRDVQLKTPAEGKRAKAQTLTLGIVDHWFSPTMYARGVKR